MDGMAGEIHGMTPGTTLGMVIIRAGAIRMGIIRIGTGLTGEAEDIVRITLSGRVSVRISTMPSGRLRTPYVPTLPVRAPAYVREAEV